MKRFQLFRVVAVVAVLLAVPALSRAGDDDMDSRHVRKVVALGSYGALAGLGAGLVLWPISGRANTLIAGAGVGACLGIAVGLYHVTHENDPENPLASWGVDLPQSTGAEAPVALNYTFRF